MRRRVKGVELYVSGHPSATAARKEKADQVGVMTSGGKPKGLGPFRTSVAQALQDYAMERLPFIMKGASQDATRIWNWAAPAENATTHLVMPAVDNGRERVMSAAEEAQPSAGRDALPQNVVRVAFGRRSATG
jgi:hypothetical protein